MGISIGKRSVFFAIAIGIAPLAAACTTGNQQSAQAAQREGRQCFNVSQVSGFHAVDRDTVQVTVGARTVYQLEIVGVCPDINWSLRVGIRSTSGSNWVCSGLDAELIVPSPSGTQRCPVTGVRQLTAEEVEASRASRRR